MKLKIIAICALALGSGSGAYAAKGGIGAIFAGLIGGAVGSVAGKAMADPQKVEKALITVANQVNQQMPMTVDADTRWDNITAGQGKRLTYNYTIVTSTSGEIDRTKIQPFFTKIKAGVCSSPDMAIFFKNGVTVAYSYRTSDGVFLSKLDITPKDCGYVT